MLPGGLKMPEVPMNALHAAIVARREDSVAVLLEAGARPEVESPPHFGTALHVAASVADPAIVKRVLAAGADPGARSTSGATALDELAKVKAALAGLLPMMSLLPPEIRKGMPDAAGFDACERLLKDAAK
jgi:ankyrin repeat protein